MAATFPFEVVLLQPRVNPNRAELIEAAGVPCYDRSDAADERLIQRQTASARERGVRPQRGFTRGKIPDATEKHKERPNSGSPVFSFKAEGRQGVSLAHIPSDLARIGFVLTEINLLRRPKDRMYVLYLKFRKHGVKPELFLTPAARHHIFGADGVLSQFYEHVHAFRNPQERSTCVNPAHILSREQCADKGFDPRYLRIDEHAHYRCELAGGRTEEGDVADDDGLPADHD